MVRIRILTISQSFVSLSRKRRRMTQVVTFPFSTPDEPHHISRQEASNESVLFSAARRRIEQPDGPTDLALHYTTSKSPWSFASYRLGATASSTDTLTVVNRPGKLSHERRRCFMVPGSLDGTRTCWIAELGHSTITRIASTCLDSRMHSGRATMLPVRP